MADSTFTQWKLFWILQISGEPNLPLISCIVTNYTIDTYTITDARCFICSHSLLQVHWFFSGAGRVVFERENPSLARQISNKIATNLTRRRGYSVFPSSSFLLLLLHRQIHIRLERRSHFLHKSNFPYSFKITLFMQIFVG